MTTAYTLAVCLLTLLTQTVCFSPGSSKTSTIVNTIYGPVNGSVKSLVTNKTVVIYLGIPFAKAGRFEYPVPPDNWTFTLQAKKIDKECPPQFPSSGLPMSEDCLQLNVYVPWNTTSSSSLAVMLFITDDIIREGSMLATEGNVLVVTAAFRVGVLGFLSANNGNLKGNYGMMDQVEAMKWVNKNIAR